MGEARKQKYWRKIWGFEVPTDTGQQNNQDDDHGPKVGNDIHLGR